MENSDRLPILALVLAAGNSKRFGSDKRLASIANSNSPLLASTVQSLKGTFTSVHIVVRAQDTKEALQLPDNSHVIPSVNSEDGIGSSIAMGIMTLMNSPYGKDQAIAIALGDMPWISPATLRLLAANADSVHIIRPVYKGILGHPVIFGRAFWPELSHLCGDEGAKSVLMQHPHAVINIPVNDSGVIQDVDRPEDLKRKGGPPREPAFHC